MTLVSSSSVCLDDLLRMSQPRKELGGEGN